MLVILRKLWFVLLFLFLASLSLGVLFGYRFSLQEIAIQQRGVLFIEGQESEVAMILDNNTSMVTLPYLDSNIEIGNHTVKLLKAGFRPYTASFQSNKDKATHLKVEFTPVESRIASTTYTTSQTLKHFFVNNQFFLEYYGDTQVLSVFEKAKSLKLHTPDRVFHLDFLTNGETVESFNSFKDTKILLKTNQHWRICVLDNFTCTLIETENSDAVFVEQKTLLAYKASKNELWTIQEQNGKHANQLSKTIDTITKTAQLPTNTQTTYDHIIQAQSGSGYILKSDFFGTWKLSPLSTGTIPIKAVQNKNEDTYSITSTGTLLSEKRGILDQGVESFYPQQKGLFIVKSLGDIILSTSSGEEFLTRFSNIPKAIISLENHLFSYIAFPTEILHCEQQRLSYCTHLLGVKKYDNIYYSERQHFFVTTTWEAPDLKISTIYVLPSENTL